MNQESGYLCWKQSRFLDALQWLALIAMTVDHASKAFGIFDNPFFVFLGRMALPLFALMLASHVVYSKNFTGLCVRLFALSLLSQPGFYLFWGNPDYAMFSILQHWNVIATLTLGAIAVKLLMLKKYLLIPIIITISFALDIDFSGYGVLVMLVFGLTQRELLNEEWREFIVIPATTIIVCIPFLISYHHSSLGVIQSGVLGISLACSLFWYTWSQAIDSEYISKPKKNRTRVPVLLWRGFYPVHFWIIFLAAYLLGSVS